jgi:hypothetical protein
MTQASACQEALKVLDRYHFANVFKGALFNFSGFAERNTQDTGSFCQFLRMSVSQAHAQFEHTPLRFWQSREHFLQRPSQSSDSVFCFWAAASFVGRFAGP